jgi:hypothetical protein
MKTFNVILYDFNARKFIPYDVIPYLVKCYKESRKKPKTHEEFRKFIEGWSQYRWWSRCEYEIILSDWPNSKIDKKIDVHWQVMLNIDLITNLVIESVNE